LPVDCRGVFSKRVDGTAKMIANTFAVFAGAKIEILSSDPRNSFREDNTERAQRRVESQKTTRGPTPAYHRRYCDRLSVSNLLLQVSIDIPDGICYAGHPKDGEAPPQTQRLHMLGRRVGIAI